MHTGPAIQRCAVCRSDARLTPIIETVRIVRPVSGIFRASGDVPDLLDLSGA